MRLIFPESKYQELLRLCTANPDATAVKMTNSELVAIYGELLDVNSAACVILSKSKKVYLDNREIQIVVTD